MNPKITVITEVEQFRHIPSFYLIKLFKGHYDVPRVIHVVESVEDLDVVAHLLN